MYTTIEIRKDFFFLRYDGKTWPTSSNIYLISDKNGLNVVDTGLNKDECFNGFHSCIRRLGFELSDVHTIILTHGHTDHIAGTNSIKKYCSAQIFLPLRSIPEATDPQAQEHSCLPLSVREIAVTVRNYDILDNFDKTCGDWKLNREEISAIKDDDELEVGAYRFQVIPVPGHDIGMLVFYEPNIELMLTADLLKSSGPGNALPWYSSSGGGPGNYRASLDRVAKYPVRAAFPAHGSLKGSLIEAVGQTRRAILKREAEILDSLKNGPKTCDQLDNILFKPVVLELCPWFSSVTESHLVELEKSGVVRKDHLEFSLVD